MLRKCKLDTCVNVFEVRLGDKRSARRQYCSHLCAQHDKPAYRATSERIETCALYLSLGFTVEQVYKDFVEGEVNPRSFLRQCERRNEAFVARKFRRWLKDTGLIPPRPHDAVRAA